MNAPPFCLATSRSSRRPNYKAQPALRAAAAAIQIISDGGAGGDKQEVDLIAECKELAQAWKYLGLKGTVPEVNFKDYFVLVVRRPLGLDLHSGGLAVAEGGEAKIQGRGVHPDEMNSRIHSSTIAIFPRSGIKTVEKTKLPATE